MIVLLQRVTRAAVRVDGDTIAAIGAGLVALVAIERDDDAQRVERGVQRLVAYRVFPDAEGRMGRSLADTGGALLLVPQFTLAADTRRGLRPDFGPAAPPDVGARWFDHAVAHARAAHSGLVETGRFGADMQVELTNDGPVTFQLQT